MDKLENLDSKFGQAWRKIQTGDGTGEDRELVVNEIYGKAQQLPKVESISYRLLQATLEICGPEGIALFKSEPESNPYIGVKTQSETSIAWRKVQEGKAVDGDRKLIVNTILERTQEFSGSVPLLHRFSRAVREVCK